MDIGNIHAILSGYCYVKQDDQIKNRYYYKYKDHSFIFYINDNNIISITNFNISNFEHFINAINLQTFVFNLIDKLNTKLKYKLNKEIYIYTSYKTQTNKFINTRKIPTKEDGCILVGGTTLYINYIKICVDLNNLKFYVFILNDCIDNNYYRNFVIPHIDITKFSINTQNIIDCYTYTYNNIIKDAIKVYDSVFEIVSDF
jgi:hypothetical protein